LKFVQPILNIFLDQSFMGIDLILIRFLRAVTTIYNSIPLVLFQLKYLRLALLVGHRLIIRFAPGGVFFVQLIHINVLETHLTHKLSLLLQTDFFRLPAVKGPIAINSGVVDGDNASSVTLVASNSGGISAAGPIYVSVERVIPLSAVILFSGLVPLGVVNLTNSFLLEVSPVDCLGVIVRNTRCFGSAGY